MKNENIDKFRLSKFALRIGYMYMCSLELVVYVYANYQYWEYDKYIFYLLYTMFFNIFPLSIIGVCIYLDYENFGYNKSVILSYILFCVLHLYFVIKFLYL